MVKYYTANTGESGWAVNGSYRDLMAGGDDVMTTGPSYTVTVLGKTTQRAEFRRDDEFYYCHDSTGKDALYTDGITGCAAVVYFYRQGTTITLVAMGHINLASSSAQARVPIPWPGRAPSSHSTRSTWWSPTEPQESTRCAMST